MASVEAGPSSIAGPFTPLVTTPSLSLPNTTARAQNAVSQLASRNLQDVGDYGPSGFPVVSESGVSSVVGAQVRWFNQGFYATTETFESWISINAPNAIAPSGHTLVDVQSFVIQ